MDYPLFELKNITKQFAKVIANEDVSFSINRGEVLALLGENGAGKSTIMKILYGLYHATAGSIYMNGRKIRISSPKQAMDYGISMIQQHFSLVPAHTVTENIILGNIHGKIDKKKAEKMISELADKYHFDVPADAMIKDLAVGVQQKVEILKALYINSSLLIMDEPTAVLTPQETGQLMTFIREFVSKGNSVVFITHKLKEVMDVADRIIVMRDGKVCGALNKKNTNEAELSRMMIGKELEALRKDVPVERENQGNMQLSLEHVSIKTLKSIPLLEDVSFELKAGEILGIAGVSGNGQQELCEVISGARTATEGSITLNGETITERSIYDRIRLGIGYVVSDRYKYGMVSDMSLSENMLLKNSYDKEFQKRGFINQKYLRSYADKMIEQYDIKAPDCEIFAGNLSGGNQQKLVVAREVHIGEKVIIFDQPTRGLDLGAINYVHQTILNEKAKGKSILLVSTELSEIFALSDRIAVLYRGRIQGIFPTAELGTEQISMLMAGCASGR